MKKQYTAMLLILFLCILCAPGIMADAATFFYQKADFNASTIDESLPAAFSVRGGGTAELVSTDRGNSIRFSVAQKNLSYIHMNLQQLPAAQKQNFQVGFSTKDIGVGDWGHRFVRLVGYTEAGARKDMYLLTFSKVSHRLSLGSVDTGLYLQNIWYDVVLDFNLGDAQKYVTVTVTAPLAPGFSASAQVDVSLFKTVSELGLYAGVTSDPSASVTLFDDVYLATKEPLSVVSSMPSEGETSVGLTTSPAVCLNHPLKPETVTGEQVKLLCAGEPVENVSVCLEEECKTIRLHLTEGASLLPNSDYSISLSGVRDIFGNTLEATEISFSTAEGIAANGISFYQSGHVEPLEELSSGTVTAQACVQGDSENVFMLLALYRKADGKLMSAARGSISPNGALSASIEVPTSCKAYCLYTYLWDAAHGQRPIIRAARLY